MQGKVLDVAMIGEPVLRQVAAAVPENTIKSPEIQQLIEDLKVTDTKENGAGLAGPQVFKSLRIFVVNVGMWEQTSGDTKPVNRFEVFINPKVKAIGNKIVKDFDGCISVGGLLGFTDRAKKIKATYFNEQGEHVNRIYTDMVARIIQHENDHLDGILWIDRVNSTADIYDKKVFNKLFTK